MQELKQISGNIILKKKHILKSTLLIQNTCIYRDENNSLCRIKSRLYLKEKEKSSKYITDKTLNTIDPLMQLKVIMIILTPSKNCNPRLYNIDTHKNYTVF